MGKEPRAEATAAAATRAAPAWGRGLDPAAGRGASGGDASGQEVPARPGEGWLERLQALATPLALPTDAAANGESASGVAVAELELAAGEVDAAMALAEPRGERLAAWLLAAWAVLLFRYNGGEVFFVGCRWETDPDGVWRPVRVQLDGAMTGAEVAAAMEAELASLPQAGITVEWMCRELGIGETEERHPVFQATFESIAPEAGDFEAAANAGEGSEDVPAPDARLLWRRRDDGGVAGAIACPRRRFLPSRVGRMARHFERLFCAMIREPDEAVARLDLLGPEEHARLREWNATAAPHDETAPVAALFVRQARETPEAVAVEWQGRAVGYGELDRRTNRLARALQARGVAPGKVVAIAMERSIEMVEAVLAVLKAGGAYVPIDPAYPEARRRFMLEDSGAVLLLTQRSLASGTEANVWDGACLCVEDLETSGVSDAPVDTPASGRDPGYVIYTSGSTGQPKGVVMPQRALTNLIAWQVARPDFARGARVLQFSSLSFDVSFQELFSTWASGGTLVLIDEATRRVAGALFEYIRDRRIERIFLPFVALRGLCEAAMAAGVAAEELSLREVYTAGEQLKVDEAVRGFFAAHPGCLLENQYGPSEAHVVTAYRLSGDAASWPVLPPIGRPIANTQIHILDAHRQPVPVGVPGELYISGVCLADGYLGRDDLTAERFVADPFSPAGGRLYRSGDLAMRLEDGNIAFLGRMDRQRKFRGYRIEPGEIAAVLSSHPEVAQAVVTIRPVEEGGERLVAYYVPRAGGESGAQPAALRQWLRARLPDYMVPTHYVRLESFPLTPSGKVDEKALPEPAFDRSVLTAEYMPARNDTERILAWIWERLLGVPRIGVRDDFFDLGGTSLLAVEMLNEVRREFGEDIPLGALARASTVETLAEVIARHAKQPDAWDSLVPIREHGEKTPFFCVHGGAGNVGSFPLLARQLPEDQPFYGLQWDGLDGSRGHRTIEGMAAHYLERVRRVQPRGPYILGGHCIGGIVAIEMAHQLIRAGERVAQLVLFDLPNVSSPVFEKTRDYSFWDETLRQRGGRKRRVWIRLCALLGIRVRPEHREEHAIIAAVAAVWRYRVRLPEGVPVLFIGTGITRGEELGMNGTWPDGAFGWSPYFGDTFEFVKVEAGHNEVYYQPPAVKAVVAALERAHASIEAERGQRSMN